MYSPTLFNAGTPTPQMSSCFLVHMKEDSIEGIFDTLKTCAQISKSAGGIGMHFILFAASLLYATILRQLCYFDLALLSRTGARMLTSQTLVRPHYRLVHS